MWFARLNNIDRLKALKILQFRNIMDEISSFISRIDFVCLFLKFENMWFDVCDLFLFFFYLSVQRWEKMYLALRASVAVLSNFITGTPT